MGGDRRRRQHRAADRHQRSTVDRHDCAGGQQRQDAQEELQAVCTPPEADQQLAGAAQLDRFEGAAGDA